MPRALDRSPRVDLQASASALDERVFAALVAVSGRLEADIEDSRSIAHVQWLATHVHLLGAIRSTHRSIRRLMGAGRGDELDLTVDALPLTRIQLERVFLVLLLAENPKRWHTRYRKNAWKVLAEKFFRDRRTVGHLEPYRDYFGPNGQGIAALRAFGREMGVTEDEFQTLRREILEDTEDDPRFKTWFIPDMPNPRKCLGLLSDPTRLRLAELFYPAYDSLSHFSHGGLAGVLGSAILRMPDAQGGAVNREQFWSSAVLETALPMSYVAAAFTATFLAREMADASGIREALLAAWRPCLCDGVPLGMAVWDTWAAEILEADRP